MNFLSRVFLYHRELSKTTYRGTWNRSNVWRLGSLSLGFQQYFAWKRISDRGEASKVIANLGEISHLSFSNSRRRSSQWQIVW